MQFGVGPDDRVNNVLNIQPVYPFKINEDWNLITRTILPVVSGAMGLGYLLAALALGAPFLALAWLLDRDGGPRWARPVFSYSLLYLALLFVALALAA